MLFYLILILISLVISILFGVIIFERLHVGENYYIITIKPLKYEGGDSFIQKMSFFLGNCKSIPNTKGKHNVILDITNIGNTTNFRLIVPENYLNDYIDIFRSNYENFNISTGELITEKDFFSNYKGGIIFRTKSDTPLLKEELQEDKLAENIKSIVSGVTNGSFQIVLNFESKNKTFIDESSLQDVKIDNTIASSNILFVKDIAVCFRFLSFEDDYIHSTMPGLVGGVLNLGGKLNNITKNFDGKKIKFNSINNKKAIRDLFYRIFYTGKLRFSHFSPSDSMFFNTKELSYIYNFVPSNTVDILPYRSYSPNEAIKYQNKIEEKEGDNNLTNVALYDYPGLKDTYFKLSDKVLRRHTYIIGKTGTGKTSTLKVFIQDDIKKGRGFALLDPHGDVTKELLEMIPEERVKDVIYVDPSIYLGRVCLGVFSFLRELRHHQEEFETSEHNKATESGGKDSMYHMETEDKFMSMVVSIIKAVSVGGKNMWGPRMDKIMKEVGTSTLKYDISEISDISYFLNIPKYRRLFISAIENEDIKESLLNFENKPLKDREEAFQPVRNRFDVFLSDTMKNIFSGKPKFSLRDAMDENKILIFCLPKGTIGDGNSSLIGSMVVSLFWAMAQTRISIPEEERIDFTLYIDEFQNFVTDSFSQILEEARKYRLRLVLANQYTKQIKHINEAVFDSIKGNIGTFIALGIGSDDSQILSKHFGIDAHDMANLPPYKGYVKCEEYSSTPFNIKMELLELDKTKVYPGGAFIKNESYKKYGLEAESSISEESFVIDTNKILRLFNMQRNTISQTYLIKSLKLKKNIGIELLKYLHLNGYLALTDEKDVSRIISKDFSNEPYIDIHYEFEKNKEKGFLSLSSYFRKYAKLPSFHYNIDSYLRDISHIKPKNKIASNLLESVSITELFGDDDVIEVDLLNPTKFDIINEPLFNTYLYEIELKDKGKPWSILSDELGFNSVDLLRLNNINNSICVTENGKITQKQVGQIITIRI